MYMNITYERFTPLGTNHGRIKPTTAQNAEIAITAVSIIQKKMLLI